MILVRMLHGRNADCTWRQKRGWVCFRACLYPLILPLLDDFHHVDLEGDFPIAGFNIPTLRRECDYVHIFTKRSASERWIYQAKGLLRRGGGAGFPAKLPQSFAPIPDTKKAMARTRLMLRFFLGRASGARGLSRGLAPVSNTVIIPRDPHPRTAAILLFVMVHHPSWYYGYHATFSETSQEIPAYDLSAALHA